MKLVVDSAGDKEESFELKNYQQGECTDSAATAAMFSTGLVALFAAVHF